jgi:hypothetical protein
MVGWTVQYERSEQTMAEHGGMEREGGSLIKLTQTHTIRHRQTRSSHHAIAWNRGSLTAAQAGRRLLIPAALFLVA